MFREKLHTLFNKGAIHIFVGNFLIKFVGLFGSIFIVRLLTKQEYGLLGYIENIYSYASIFAGLGISLGIMRYLILAQNQEERKTVYIFALKFQIIFNLAFIVLTKIIFGYLLDNKFMDDIGILLNIYLLSILFLDIIQTNMSLERALLENKKYVVISLLFSIISVTFRIIGAHGGGLAGVVIGKVSADMLVAIGVTIYVYKMFFNKDLLISSKRKILNKKEIITYSFHNMISNGIWILFMITDVFLISYLTNNPTILAEYKVAYMIPSNMAIITSSIITFIAPYFIKNENNKAWVKRNYMKALKINCIIMGGLLIILEVLASPIIYVLYGENYLNVVPLMRILLVAHFINSAIKTFTASLLTSMGYARENLIISVGGFVLQVVMAYNVIPVYGVIGLATGSIIVYTLITITVIVVFIKKFEFLKLKG